MRVRNEGAEESERWSSQSAGTRVPLLTRERVDVIRDRSNRRGRSGLTMPAVQAKAPKASSPSEARILTPPPRLPTAWERSVRMRSGCTRTG